MPKWPRNGSAVTYVSLTRRLRPALRSWYAVLKRNSYAAPKQPAPWVAATTTSPGSARKRRQPSPAWIASSSVVMVSAFPPGPSPGTTSNRFR